MGVFEEASTPQAVPERHHVADAGLTVLATASAAKGGDSLTGVLEQILLDVPHFRRRWRFVTRRGLSVMVGRPCRCRDGQAQSARFPQQF